MTCFGYLGYRNAKFGTVDGHIGVCAFGREAFLKAARMAEARGFEVIHGIVDSLWLKKTNATVQEYPKLCKEVSEKIGVPLNFEGLQMDCFSAVKMHPNIGVLNRYYGVMENGKVKVRGIEVRRRDTPRFIYNVQMEMIKVLSSANNAKQFMEKIPEALNIVKDIAKACLTEKSHLGFDCHETAVKASEKVQAKVSQVIAAEQLMKEGAEVHAGKNVRFLFHRM